MKPNLLQTVAAGFVVVLATLSAQAQISYTTPGSTYSQDFDSLPNTPQNVSLGSSPTGWTDDNAAPGAGAFSIVGWYLYHPLLLAEGGANGHQRVRIGAGTANTGGFMSFGASGGTDRALGDVGSNTLSTNSGPIWINLRLKNNTGAALTDFTLTYDGEQWRDGGDVAPNAQTMSFMWSTTATASNDPDSAFTPVTALNFTSPIFLNTGSGGAVDGNSSTGRVAGITATVSGITWADGADLWLRWDDINNAGNDHGLAIDNLTFSAIVAVPEPSTWGLIALGITGLFLTQRLRRR